MKWILDEIDDIPPMSNYADIQISPERIIKFAIAIAIIWLMKDVFHRTWKNV